MSHKSKAAEFVNEGYDIHVTGRHVLVTGAMKDYAIDKIAKLDKFSQRIIDVQVTMDIQKLEHRVDIIMKVDNILIKASGLSNDMYASIDKAVDKIKEQIRRYKSRIQDHQAKKIITYDMKVNVYKAPEFDEEVKELNAEIENEARQELIEKYRPHEIVSDETIPLKVLTNGEAIMKMELSGEPFLLFISEVDRKLKLIYRREDKHFGIMEPEYP
jgi:putative sigma-54 modulation protein